jgi:hypothetical protein
MQVETKVGLSPIGYFAVVLNVLHYDKHRQCPLRVSCVAAILPACPLLLDRCRLAAQGQRTKWGHKVTLPSDAQSHAADRLPQWCPSREQMPQAAAF